MTDDSEHESGWLDGDDEFDRQVGQVLESEASLLRENAELLVAAGAISIARPGGVVSAWLKLPRRGRSGFLRLSCVRGSDGETGTSFLPLRGRHDPEFLLQEITLQLAVELASLSAD